MRDYTNYSREDFLADESFGNYLLEKDQQSVLFWQNWIKENPENLHEVREAEKLFFLMRTQNQNVQDREEVKDNYAKLVSMIGSNGLLNRENEISQENTAISTRTFGFKKVILWAASVAAVLVIGFSVWMYSNRTNDAPTQFSPYAQSFDQPNMITLVDGTVIHLNSHSSIAISKSFNQQKREISLTGSAFFKVAKDHSKPFTVTSGDIKTTALGTSFYIFNLDKKSTSVALLEGKVLVEGFKNSVELLPGEKAFLNEDATIYKVGFDEKQLQDFVLGKISFDKASLEQIKTVLQEYYNMNVEIKGDVPSLNFTGEFDAKNIKSILEALEFTYNIHYKINGQTLTLSFN